MNRKKGISSKRVKTFWGVLLSLCVAFTFMPAALPSSANAVSASNAAAALYKADGKTVVRYYSSLKSAIKGLSNNNRIIKVLNKDVTLTGGITVNRDYKYTIDLNGHSVTGSSTSALLDITAGTVGIANGTITNTGGGSAVAENGGSAVLPEDYSGSISSSSLSHIPQAHFVNLTAEGNGSQTLNGSSWTSGSRFIRTGSSLHLTFTPSDTSVYEVAGLTVNGADKGKITSYTIADSSRTRDYSVSVKYDYISFNVQAVTMMGSSANTICGTIDPAGTTAVRKGESRTFTISAKDGYQLDDVVVDGVSQGAVTSYTFSNVNEDHTISAYYEKTALFIMLDPGHFKNYNKGAVSGYYEGNQMWKLGNYLESALKEYPGIIVGKTKSSLMTYESGVYARGLKAKGYDLFVSLHSNSSDVSSVDYPLAIVSANAPMYTEARGVGVKLAKVVKSTMNTKQDYQIWIKRQSDGRDWYGVIRGAAEYDVPAVIVEHSFHSNRTAAKWLMSDANLQKMADNEAAAIADYYGLSKDGTVAAPKKPTGFRLTVRSSSKIKISWTKSLGATGYQIYRKDSSGNYTKIATTSSSSYTDSGLVSKTTYTYKIRAYRTNGSAKTTSSCASARSATTK